MSKIVIAGGTGFIGRFLERELVQKGHQVVVLTRRPKEKNHSYWNPETTQIDLQAIMDAEVLINLCGAGIADKRWNEQRKKELYDSRVGTTSFLYEIFNKSTKLKQYITASGINCYPLLANRTYVESDPYGEDYVSQLVRQWEEAASRFEANAKVYCMRTSMVLHPDFGALKKMALPIKMGLGSVLGSGKQNMTWIHHSDLVKAFLHVIENNPPSGAYNICAETVNNSTFTHALAKVFKRKIWLPKTPGFLLKIALGKMSLLLLTGIKADTSKIQASGFKLDYPTLDEALQQLYS